LRPRAPASFFLSRRRDWDKLRELDFPVFCTGLNIVGPDKSQPGVLGVPITVGGASISPGDLIVGDSDGCVVVPAADAAVVVAAARKRAKSEVGVIRRLDRGDTTLEIYGP